MRKERRQRGETLIETLAAILIVTLASLLFMQLSITTGKMNAAATHSDAVYNTQLTEAETGEGTVSGFVTVDGREYPVTYAGEEDGLTSYTGEEVAP